MLTTRNGGLEGVFNFVQGCLDLHGLRIALAIFAVFCKELRSRGKRGLSTWCFRVATSIH